MDDSIKPDLKIGLALGSGAARGIAHIGVIKALHEANIPIHLVAGTSMGSIIGACYAAEGKIEHLEEIAVKSNLNKLAKLLDPHFSIFSNGLLQGGRVENFLKTIIGNKDFSDLAIPFSAVATDLITGSEVILDKGSVIQAVRASISIPVIFVPVHYLGMYLVDGGTTNPVPANVVRSMGANFTIAVNVLNDPKKRKHVGLIGDKQSTKVPSIYNQLIQSLYIMEYEIIRTSIFKADIVIEPDLINLQSYEFFKGQEAIEAGYSAATKIIPEIKKLIRTS